MSEIDKLMLTPEQIWEAQRGNCFWGDKEKGEAVAQAQIAKLASLTDEEMEKQIAKIIAYNHAEADEPCLVCKKIAKEICVLIAARYAGWIDPTKVIMPGEFNTPKSRELMKQAGYVKLAEDQQDLYDKLTENFVEPVANLYISGKNKANFYDLWKQFKRTLVDFRKVELEGEKDG